MALDPDDKPKEFLTIIIATGLKVFGNRLWDDKDCLNAAEKFVAEIEQRYGKLNP
jgi:hypothetical protein